MGFENNRSTGLFDFQLYFLFYLRNIFINLLSLNHHIIITFTIYKQSNDVEKKELSSYDCNVYFTEKKKRRKPNKSSLLSTELH
jgi:hypothetical protein